MGSISMNDRFLLHTSQFAGKVFFTLSRDKGSLSENVLELILGQGRVSAQPKQMFADIVQLFWKLLTVVFSLTKLISGFSGRKH